jgi:prepilin-type N-terminal cleavage/methylation domain-containing protein
MQSASRNKVQESISRSGLTLIELLIVVTIFLLLTTFTVVAVDFTFEAERVSSGARQVQSLLEGARDRAIRARQPRGVRLLLDQDQDNGRMVSSFVYIGSEETWTEGTIQLQRPDFITPPMPPATVPTNIPDGIADQDSVIIVQGSLDALWNRLKLRGFLTVYEDDNENGWLDPGEDDNGDLRLDTYTPRIKIPRGRDGVWYRVRTDLLGSDPVNPNVFVLTREYRGSALGRTPASQIAAFEDGSGPTTYELELPPRILPDATPVLLPGGVVIDLDASDLPTAWRPLSAVSLPLPEQYRRPYSSRMDLMFSPRGTLIGTAGGNGVVHLYVALRDDVQKATDASRPAVSFGMNPFVPADPLFASLSTGGSAPVVGDRGLVSVFATTGQVSSHRLNLDNTDADPDYLDDPFRFAELGEVSQ